MFTSMYKAPLTHITYMFETLFGNMVVALVWMVLASSMNVLSWLLNCVLAQTMRGSHHTIMEWIRGQIKKINRLVSPYRASWDLTDPKYKHKLKN